MKRSLLGKKKSETGIPGWKISLCLGQKDPSRAWGKGESRARPPVPGNWLSWARTGDTAPGLPTMALLTACPRAAACPRGAGPYHPTSSTGAKLQGSQASLFPFTPGWAECYLFKGSFYWCSAENTGIIHGGFWVYSGDNRIFILKIQIMVSAQFTISRSCPPSIKQQRLRMFWKPSLAGGSRGLSQQARGCGWVQRREMGEQAPPPSISPLCSWSASVFSSIRWTLMGVFHTGSHPHGHALPTEPGTLAAQL